MAEFRKQGNFRGGGRPSGGFRQGGGDRTSFGHRGGFRGHDSRGDSRPQMHSATCANCNKACEVPFRPSGERPVYCKDCFVDKKDMPQGDRGGRDARRSYEKRSPAPFIPPAPKVDDKRIDELKQQVDAMGKKLDTMIGMIQALGVTMVVKKVAKKATVNK